MSCSGIEMQQSVPFYVFTHGIIIMHLFLYFLVIGVPYVDWNFHGYFLMYLLFVVPMNGRRNINQPAAKRVLHPKCNAFFVFDS